MEEAKPAFRSVATKFKILLSFFPTATKTPVKRFVGEEKGTLGSKLGSKSKPPSSALSNTSARFVSNYVKGSHPHEKSAEGTHIPGTFLPPKVNENNWVTS